MLNRRHLRVKVLQYLYAFYQTNDGEYGKAEKELLDSVERIYDLYLYLLLTFGEFQHLGVRRIDENKKKRIPKEEDLNPNMKFVENKVIDILNNQVELRAASERSLVNWIGDEEQEVLRKAFLVMRESEVFFQYMNNGESSFEDDKNFALDLFRAEIANSELIYEYFEEKSIHWIDDIDLACSMVLKTIKAFEEGEDCSIMPLYKDEEDEVNFIKTLFRRTIALDKENEKLIDEYTKNWELDRIAKMDVLLMKMAVTELREFNNIPTKVTLNEYIEISKFYSTPKSNGFINGVLDKIIVKLESDGLIKKAGRGLMK